jgi:hypothetical protein
MNQGAQFLQDVSTTEAGAGVFARLGPKADAVMRICAHWSLCAMMLRNVSEPKKVRFATRRRASALKLSTMV